MKKSIKPGLMFVLLFVLIVNLMPVGTVGAATVPEISRISPADNGEVFQLFGEGLLNNKVHVWKPTGTVTEVAYSAALLPAVSSPASTPPTGSSQRTPLASFDQVSYVKAIYAGVTVIWVKNATGYSVPWIANQPEIWSMSQHDVMPGERLQLYGQNLYVKGISNTQIPVVHLRNTVTGATYDATWGLANDQEMPNQNNFKFDLLLPSDMAAGEYQLWVHNGSGGVYGWSKPVSLTVVSSRDLIGYESTAWNRVGTQTDGQTLASFPFVTVASPPDEGVTDSTYALQSAIDSMALAGGGVVTLKAGTYGITQTLEMKPNVVLKGAGKGATTITVAFGNTLAPWSLKPDETPLIWLPSDSGIEDLRLLGGQGVSSLAVVHTFSSSPAKRVFFNRIEGDYSGNSKLLPGGAYVMQNSGIQVLSGTEQLTVWDSSIKAASVLRGDTPQHKQLHLIGNHFEVSPRQGTINVVIKGLYDSVVTENTFVNGKRSFMSQLGFSRNWIFQNRSSGVSRGNNGQEEFMSEFGKANWLGRADSISTNSIYVASITDNFPLIYGGTVTTNTNNVEHYIYVVQGRGVGQVRKVSSISSGVFQLEEPWTVLPDSTTIFAFMNYSTHNLWVNNTTENGSGISQFIYGAGVENIIAGHEMTDNGGISLWAPEYKTDAEGKMTQYGVLAYNQVINSTNRFSGSSNAGIMLWSRSGTTIEYSGTPYTIFGNIVRGNAIAGSGEAALFKNQFSRYWLQAIPSYLNFNPAKTSGIELNGGYNLVEQNFSIGLPNGIRIRGNGVGNMIYNNRIDDAVTPVLDETTHSIITPPANQTY